MTAKEKAYDLFTTFRHMHESHVPTLGVKMAIKCAALAVDELIRVTPWGGDEAVNEDDGSKEFYMNVKRELKKISHDTSRESKTAS